MAVNSVSPGVSAGIGSTVKKDPVDKSEGAAKAEKATRAGAAGAYAKAAAQKPTVSEAAHVQISPKARELSLAKKVIDETPDVREDKVAQFKDLIAKGQYKPDANKITEGLIKEALRDELSKEPDIALS